MPMALALISLLGMAAVDTPPRAERAPCSGPAFELARRFEGTWKEYTLTKDGEVLAGTLRSGLEAGGCAFSQRFASADGSFTFMSFGYVEPSTGRWHETFVLSNGRVASYSWREDGDAVIMERVGGDPTDRRRLRIVDLEARSYDVVEERSTDGGRTWGQVGDVTRTRRDP